jgi:PAS domain S-box-containing protein
VAVPSASSPADPLPEGELFRVLGGNIPGVVYLCRNDARYTMLYLNAAVEELLGIPASEFLADRASFVELYHPEDAPIIGREVDAAIAARRPFRLTYRLRHKSGRWVSVEEYGQGVFDADGTLRFLEGTVFDITERVQADLQLRRARDLLEERVAERTQELAEANASLRDQIAEREAAVRKLRAEERLSRRLLELQEQERKLVAYEIHDGLLQSVVGAQLMVAAAKESATPDVALLEQAWKLLSEAIAEGRRLIGDLRPLVIDEFGLVEAIAYAATEAGRRSTCQFEVTADVEFLRLPPLLETALFRIAQEALHNIVRHSQARHALVRLKQRGQQLEMEVTDDGVGFDPDQDFEEHFGLEGIAKRARIFGGHCEITSAPGKGSRIRVEIPLAGEAVARIHQESK